jgi:hypothetical protein
LSGSPLRTPRVDVPDKGQGRQCERCRLLTRLVLFSPGGHFPRGWLLVLVAACSYVLMRVLETGGF